MAANKEMNIVFVYDRERCTSEEDDPIAAVSYFHPSWVSDVHRLTLCGQLMGVAQFLNLNFNEARMIVLQSGKFLLTSFGRFILVVGTDRNITDAALAYRSELLTSVVRLYHKSLETVYEQCMASSSNYKTVTDKFYHIFETYLPLLQHQNTVFNSLPVLKMPPSANCVYVEAIQTLQDCRQLRGVIGGTILYHNKIVSTQLPSSVSKLFVLTDPYRIKTTASQVTVPYHVPVGVQLVAVYMSLRDFQRLRSDSQRAFTLQNNSVQNGGSLPFQIKRKPRAREKSLLFSNIPEEEALNGFNEAAEAPQPGPSSRPNGLPIKQRPTHLPLRMKNETAREVPESGFSSINFDETDSFPQFIGKTSVCATPLLENRILDGNLLSICANQVILEQPEKKQEEEDEEEEKVANTEEIVTITKAKNGKIRLEDKFPELKFNNIRGNSLKDKLARYTSVLQMPKLFTGKSELTATGRPKYQTITDPSYPVFNEDGLPISKSMFDERGIEVGVDIAQDVESLKIEGFPSENDMIDDEMIAAGVWSGQLPERQDSGLIEEIKSNGNGGVSTINDIVFRNKPKDPSIENHRRSLTLPIQAINLDPLAKPSQASTSEAGTGSSEGEDRLYDKPQKRVRADFPVSNLMSKIIAQLPFDNGLSCMTPVMTPITRPMSFIPKVDEVNEEDEEAAETAELQKIELFVCGQQNMTMLIAMEESSGQTETLVQSLWETCISRLPKIESNLQQTLNVNVDGVVDKNDMNYSFMCFDPNWDVIQQGGHWAANELQAVEDIHSDFKENGTFTETLVRCQDAIVYGYRCGDTEVYYKEPTSQLRGIPQPGDGMGNAPQNAKLRLERDHSIILL